MVYINGYLGYYTHYLIEYMGYWVYSNHIWDIQWCTTIFGIYNIFGIYWVYTTIFMGYVMNILEYTSTIFEIALIVTNGHIWDIIPIIKVHPYCPIDQQNSMDLKMGYKQRSIQLGLIWIINDYTKLD